MDTGLAEHGQGVGFVRACDGLDMCYAGHILWAVYALSWACAVQGLCWA
jgi:hypothetical protein